MRPAGSTAAALLASAVAGLVIEKIGIPDVTAVNASAMIGVFEHQGGMINRRRMVKPAEHFDDYDRTITFIFPMHGQD